MKTENYHLFNNMILPKNSPFMFIKYLVLVLSGLMFSLFSKAQDNIFGYYEILVSSQIPVPNTPEALQQIHFSPSSNTGSFGSGSAVAGSTINYIGLNKNHYLFSIEPVSTDKFHVNSFNTQNIFLARRKRRRTKKNPRKAISTLI